MGKVLVVYHSETGNTEKMAKAIAEGANADLKKVSEATNDNLVEADAIIIGSPTYYRQMSWKMKKFIDDSDAIYKKLENKIGAIFTSCADLEDGKKCVESLKEALDCHGMKVVGSVISKDSPTNEKLKECRKLGENVASMVK